MADIAKYAPVNGGTLISDFKSNFSVLGTKRTRAVAYAFAVVFMGLTLFLAFAPSSNSSSPWFTNIFTLTPGNASAPTSAAIFSDESYRSRFSSLFSYFSPNNSLNGKAENASSLHKEPSPMENSTNNGGSQKASISPQKPFLNVPLNNSAPTQDSSELSNGSLGVQKNQTQNNQLDDKAGVFKQNLTQTVDFQGKDLHLKTNQSTYGGTNSEKTVNKTANSSLGSASQVKGAATNGGKQIGETAAVNNLTSSLKKKPNNGIDAKVGTGTDELIKSLSKCDLFDGSWVRDDSYPLYKPGSCSLIDEQFNCFLNGRPDNSYYKLKWKPKGCTLPRLSGSHMLEMLRGKRLVFVGDSLNRNMWESLICILKNSVKDQKKVYEEFGRHHFRTEASYSFVFEDYKCTVEFFVSPFLVEEWEVTDAKGSKKETLRLDLISPSAYKYKNADIIVFNTGHWWTHEKTSKGKDYYQEGTHVYGELNVVEAFRKALTYWGRWVDSNINPMKSLVFFRGYSASHFSGGQWNSGGQCDHETDPIKNETYLSPYPQKMAVLEKVLKGMKTPVTYLNVTRMTDYRKDGHPSIYRKLHVSDEERRSPLSYQDCSHWCLPGVPDSWNEILYAQLLVKLNQKPGSKKRDEVHT